MIMRLFQLGKLRLMKMNHFCYQVLSLLVRLARTTLHEQIKTHLGRLARRLVIVSRTSYSWKRVCCKHIQQVAQLSERDRAAGWVSFGQKWKMIFYRQYTSTFNHCNVIGLQSCWIRWNKAK